MFEEKNSYSVRILSKLIDSPIFYMSKCNQIIRDNKFLEDLQKAIKQNCYLAVCSNMLVLFTESFNKIKFKIQFENIERLDLDIINEKLLKICCKSSINNFKEIYLSVCNRNTTMTYISDHYLIHYSQIYGRIEEIHYTYCRNLFDEQLTKSEIKLAGVGINEMLLNNRVDDFAKNCPKDCILRNPLNYMFYVKKGFSENENLDSANIFYYPKSKELNRFNSTRFQFEMGENLPIETLVANRDIEDFSFYSYRKFSYYIQNNFKINKYSILYNSTYIKKFNCGQDSSLWEGWKIECRTKPDKLENRGFNLIFIFLRRKYTPPFFDTYQDFTFLIMEDYLYLNNLFSVDISNFAVNIIETAVNSFSPEDSNLIHRENFKILQSKMDALLVDNESCDYFINTLQVYGKETYKLGLAFTLKFVLIFEEFFQKIIKTLKTNLLQRINNAYLQFGFTDFSIVSYESFIKSLDSLKITDENDIFCKKIFITNSEIDKKYLELWEEKRNKFLVYCLNGGLTNNLLDLRMIISWLKKVGDLRFINDHINKLLNFRVISINSEVIEPNINSMMYNIYNIKAFFFNEDLLCVLIEKDYLRSLQKLEFESIYVTFLKFILEEHFSNKILLAIYFYLKSLNKQQFKKDDESSDEDEADTIEDSTSIKYCLSGILPNLLKIYSNKYLCPTVISIACKCLIILTSFDKFNKIAMVTPNIIETITLYMKHPDEKLAYYSGELFSNCIVEAKDSIVEILVNNPTFISRSLRFLKGQSVPDVYYSSKSILLALGIIKIILSLHNIQLKEFFCGEKNRKFIKYLINLIQDNGFALTKFTERTFSVIDKVFDALEYMVNKNTDMRRYMEDNFKILKVIDFKCLEYLEIIKAELGITNININKNINDMDNSFRKMLLGLFKFLKAFISKDKHIIKEINTNYFNITEIVRFVNENQANTQNFTLFKSDVIDLCNTLFTH